MGNKAPSRSKEADDEEQSSLSDESSLPVNLLPDWAKNDESVSALFDEEHGKADNFSEGFGKGLSSRKEKSRNYWLEDMLDRSSELAELPADCNLDKI
mmetsp:Transcript_3386/g.6983  ORF Transcript_3386/g.6983 Transcript_3386/m.6983 type:complete len:98 (-) Transcript_3386:1284-1577(-)